MTFELIHTRPDGQVFGIETYDDTEFQSVVPIDMAHEGYFHTTYDDALAHIHDLILNGEPS